MNSLLDLNIFRWHFIYSMQNKIDMAEIRTLIRAIFPLQAPARDTMCLSHCEYKRDTHLGNNFLMAKFSCQIVNSLSPSYLSKLQLFCCFLTTFEENVNKLLFSTIVWDELLPTYQDSTQLPLFRVSSQYSEWYMLSSLQVDP